MSYAISLRTELIKVKRSASFWLCIIGAGFIPGIFFLMYTMKPSVFIPLYKIQPWESHFIRGWQSFSSFLLPMFVIIICSQLLQIEYKNNTWKQVFASPQTLGNIFFSKLSMILLMVFFLFLMFNLFMILSALATNLFIKGYNFFSSGARWDLILIMNMKTFVALLAIIAFQYWLSLRIKNFIVPIGIGLLLIIASIILMQWEHIYKLPYAYPLLTFVSLSDVKHITAKLSNHQLNSIGYFAFFTALAFVDMKYRKERG